MRFGFLLALGWLAMNAWFLIGPGLERVRYDAGLAGRASVAEKRAGCWNNQPGLPAEVLDFERRLDEIARRETPPKLLLVVSASTIAPSIARHRLFPTPVMHIQGRAREVAEQTGADLAIRIGKGGWSIFDPRK